MIVYLDSKFFNIEEITVRRKIDQFFVHFENGKHEWIIEKEEDLDTFSSSIFLDKQSKDYYELYAELALKSFDKSINTIAAHKSSISINLENLDDGSNCLNETLLLIVENIESDKYFIDALIRCFNKHSKKIIKARENNWMQLAHAGGKDAIEPLIRYHKDRTPQSRLFVLIDSDTNNPAEAQEKQYNKGLQKVLDCCSLYKVPYHVLYKREIENYLPDEALNNLPDQLQGVLQEFIKLSDNQRDFFDLEKGFNDKSSPSENQQELYNSLSPTSINVLRKGFNKKDVFDAKKKFPKMFSDTINITNNTLLSRCNKQPNPNELKEILDNISNFL